MMPTMPDSGGTIVLPADADGVARAGKILRQGGLVAFPTETVYGLGADALEAAAVRGIFAAKGRPADDPLIVHVASAAHVGRVAHLSQLAERLAERFWPGPLTLVLPKTPAVPTEVTAGLETVAVRVPAHPVAQALLKAADQPLAAPSANLFSRLSPTRVEHVLEDLNGRIDAILDGGPTRLGLESTIVDVTGAQPRLLRPGGLAAEEIEAALGKRLVVGVESQAGPRPAPGLMLMHYAPRTPLVLIVGEPGRARTRLEREVRQALARGRRVGVLLLEDDGNLFGTEVTRVQLGSWNDAQASAVRFFDALRELDRAELDVLFSRELADPRSGLGRALADRLRRAASRVVD
jgi:L-threonylcarbamoyladenylate synthase